MKSSSSGVFVVGGIFSISGLASRCGPFSLKYFRGYGRFNLAHCIGAMSLSCFQHSSGDPECGYGRRHADLDARFSGCLDCPESGFLQVCT
jgi:hypothetical protein